MSTSGIALEPLGVRPGSLTEIVFDRIRDAITSKSLAPGSRVSESSLAGMLHVSKTPVREALLRLCYVGLVEPTTRGLRVVLPNRENIRDAYEVRSGLESQSARHAALRAPSDQRAEIAEAAQASLRSAQLGDMSGFANWDNLFHVRVGYAGGNKLLGKAVEDAVALAFTLRSRDVPTVDDSVHCGEQHVMIAAAISGRDVERADELMVAHVEEVLQYVLSFVD